jgi:hypothetical protein
MSNGAGRSRVFLHVGSPKTGTTFLQDVLWSQRERASEQGLLLPGERFDDHYLATLDLRGLSGRAVHPLRSVGMWTTLVAEATGHRGTTLISHELFAAATADQAARGIADLRQGGAEVHVVLTARDLVRQLTAEWQEHVKHRSTKTLEQFVADARGDASRTSWFWQVQDFAGVLERWGATLPPEQVHVITVPPAGTPPDELWRRFATLLGLDPAAFDTDLPRANTSLGLEQAELLRQVNAALGDRLPLPGPYPLVVKNVLAHRILETYPGTRLALAPDDAAFAAEQSQAVADRIAALGIDVIGDLAELTPAAPTGAAATGTGPTGTGYEVPDAEALLPHSVAAIADLLVVINNRRKAQDVIAQATDHPVRFALVQSARTRPSLQRLLGLYRRLRARR